jgi:hypothetical protein
MVLLQRVDKVVANHVVDIRDFTQLGQDAGARRFIEAQGRLGLAQFVAQGDLGG